jgi:putative hydrolase of the HAD superfamily
MGVKGIYLDIGGVLLTNGWDTAMRKKAAAHFGFDFEEMDARHALMFEAHELGKISLDTYLDFTLFYEKRTFTNEQFKQYMRDQSLPHQEMIDLIQSLKKQHGLKVGTISNEGRELTRHRVQWLKSFVDFFVVSCFVHLKKPDPAIYQLALDVGQIPAHEVVYIDDRGVLVEVANSLGFKGLHHTGFETTKKALAAIF